MQISEYLYVPLITWALAQGVKFFIAMIKGQYRPSLLFSSGGMPSVHSATVASLATVALIEGGAGGPLFGITGIFAAIVMYDSLGVRRAAGEQAKALNHLIADLQQAGTLKGQSQYGHLREVLGHRPLEVLIGLTMGIVTAGLFLNQQVLKQASWLLSDLHGASLTAELILIGLLILSGVGSFLSAQSGPRQRFRPFLKQIMVSNIVMSAALLIIVLIQNQQLRPWNNWLTLLVIAALFVGWHLVLWYQLLVDGHLRQEIAISQPEERRKKWLTRTPRTRADRRRHSRRK